MTVKEFSTKIGMPCSKIRFYDRSRIIEGAREVENNYRSFTNSDALNIYNAQMLRSFDFSIPDVMHAKGEELLQINLRVHNRIDELEKTIREQEIRLTRLKEMQAYFSEIEQQHTKVTCQVLDASYNVFTINCIPSPDEFKTVKMLADVMPFSYICLRISRESIIKKEIPLKVCLGLGILNSNKEKIGLEIPVSIKRLEKNYRIGMRFETIDPFNLTVKDIKPLLDEMKDRKLELVEDIVGRIFISYKKNGQIVHGIGIGTSFCE
ncbi:MerR family transcriptional regulator [Marispirochaeta aestuarii]|uniref:MerR family transcriptional regulator n=1 Tax=Marispirochaeta aestuarii TaxID=1963862 RepID=UPI0029C8AE05|nr:MerR family transcriptional regulator [Marispirochaeta aestuarii]